MRQVLFLQAECPDFKTGQTQLCSIWGTSIATALSRGSQACAWAPLFMSGKSQAMHHTNRKSSVWETQTTQMVSECTEHPRHSGAHVHSRGQCSALRTALTDSSEEGGEEVMCTLRTGSPVSAEPQDRQALPGTASRSEPGPPGGQPGRREANSPGTGWDGTGAPRGQAPAGPASSAKEDRPAARLGPSFTPGRPRGTRAPPGRGRRGPSAPLRRRRGFSANSAP
eukprot:XP_025006926.1 uncharacterized protein LOC112532523 [Gallus gallus]